MGLLDTLELPNTYGIVIPVLSHLGPKRIASERRQQITATSTRLIVVRSNKTIPGPVPFLGASPGLQQQGGT